MPIIYLLFMHNNINYFLLINYNNTNYLLVIYVRKYKLFLCYLCLNVANNPFVIYAINN